MGIHYGTAVVGESRPIKRLGVVQRSVMLATNDKLFLRPAGLAPGIDLRWDQPGDVELFAVGM
jgi:hypothetical protein